jgi:hypothetical protein
MNLIHRLHDYNNPDSLASRFRAARSRHIRTLIETVYAEQGRCRIIDLGGSGDYWRAFGMDQLKRCGVTVTVLNVKPSHEEADGVLTFVLGDACETDFEDQSFDICHSNSVVEHVGEWGRMERFAGETRRLAPRYYVQTPYYWFPVEPHYSSVAFHWLPRPVQVRRLMRRGHGFHDRAASLAEAVRTFESATLLDKSMMSALFPDADLVEEKVLGLTKSLMAVKT